MSESRFSKGDRVRVNSPESTFHGQEAEVARVFMGGFYGVVVGDTRYEFHESELVPVGPTIYIAGPMTGHPQFNFPVFDAAAADLRSRGYRVVSPAELDDPTTREAALASPDGAPGSGSANGETWGDFLSRDVKLIADSGIEGIAVLPGWEKSRGARLETFVGARMVGLPVYRYGPEDPMEQVTDAELAAAHAGVELSELVPGAPALAAQVATGGNPKDALATAEDKAPLDYLEPAAEEGIARALKFGADKYGVRNYTKVPIRARVYVAAIKRHADAWLRGEDVAADSGLHHLAHIGANVHVALAAMEAGTFIDDRHGHEDDELEAAA